MVEKFLPVLLGMTVLLGACTAQEKKIIHELEDMPGITCEVDEQSGLDNCHPDSLETALESDAPTD